jgi:5-methylcytosine-specific restriction protein A
MATPCQGACGALVKTPGKCSRCRRKEDRTRPTAHQRGYTERWARESKLFLRAHPVCVCKGEAPGCKGFAQVTDHIIPHHGDQVLFWDPANWQPLSKRCHDVKTATQDGGLGNARKHTPTNDRPQGMDYLRTIGLA